MKKYELFHRGRILATLTAAVMAVLTVGCSSPSTSPATIPSQTQPPGSTAINYLPRLQQTKTLQAQFKAMVSFKSGTSTLTYASIFQVPPVPVTWTNSSFNGKLEETGPGEDITDEVNGVAASDGMSLSSLVYSRQVIRTGTGSGTFYRLTLQNVPIASFSNGILTSFGSFDMSGPGLKQYVTQVEYVDGPLNNGQISPVTVYLSTGWENSNPGEIPSLKVTFGY